MLVDPRVAAHARQGRAGTARLLLPVSRSTRKSVPKMDTLTYGSPLAYVIGITDPSPA